MKNFFNKSDIEQLIKFSRYTSSYDWGMPKNKIAKTLQHLRIRISKSKSFLKLILEIANANSFSKQKKLKNFDTLFVYNISDPKNPEYWYKRYYGESKKGLSTHLFIKEFNKIKIFYFDPNKGFSKSKQIFLESKKNYIFLLFFLPIFPFYPKLCDYLTHKINLVIFDKIIKLLKPNKIIYPFEGQSWEYAIVQTSFFYKIKTLGFIHALNITTAINNRIIFNKDISPDILLTINSQQSEYLITRKNWPRERIKFFNLNRKSPLDSLFINKNSKKSNIILFLGSYFQHEDNLVINLIKYHKNLFKSFDIFYKPHPLNINKTNSNNSKGILKIINNLDQLNNILPDKIITPLSSTSSLELLSFSSIPLIIYRSKKYCSPSPFDQFDVQPIIIDEDNLYSNNLFNQGPLNFLKNNKNINNLDFKNYNID